MADIFMEYSKDDIDQKFSTLATPENISNINTQLADITIYAYVEQFPIQVPETDDTARIQRAIDSLKTTGGIVQLTNKIYNTSAPLKLYSNITLRGVQRFQTQIISQGDIPTITNEGYFTLGVGNYEIKIERLGIYPRGVTSKTHYGITLVNTYNCRVEDCYINGSTMTTNDVEGIAFTKDTSYTGNHFVNAVRRCQLQNASIVMQSTDSYIEQSEIWGYTRPFGVHLIKSSQFVSDCQIVGSPVHGGIYVKDDVDNFNVETIRLDNVYFDGSYNNVDSGMGLNATNMINSHITNCDFWHLMDQGISLTSGYGVSIIGNTFKNNDRRVTGADDIYLNGCSVCTIVGNNFNRDASTPPAILGHSVKTVASPDTLNVITGNTVYNTGNYNVPNTSNKDLVVNNSGMGEKKRYVGTNSPNTGSWNVGDIFYNSSPVASGNIGWVCVTSGSPGTWKTFGTIGS